MIPIDTSNDESMVEEMTNDPKTQDAMPQDGHHNAKESPQYP